MAAGTALNSNSALNELATNAGTFSLASGAKVATASDFLRTVKSFLEEPALML